MKSVEMPKMGDTMEEGKILQWLKQEGDAVKKGEMLAEVETDKVNIEIESFFAGTLRKILVPAGSAAPIGAPIALIGSADEPLTDENSGNGAAKQETAAAQDGVAGQGSVAAHLIAPGGGRDHSASTGVINAAATPSATDVINVATTPMPSSQGRIFISPIARRLAGEHQLDYRAIRGSGPNGRIIRMDIEAALREQPPVAAQFIAPAIAEEPPSVAAQFIAPVGADLSRPFAPTEDIIEIPLSNMRRTIARRLTQSMQSAPHFYVTSVIDATKLGALRQQINDYAARDPSPIKVSFNDLIVKAVALALVRMPRVNVSFAEDKILQKKQVNIGIAVALEEGLIVPVLHNADKRGLLDIARESRRLAEAARENKLRPEDFSGGTFTVSNLGMFDVESFTAVINPPESAILAVGSITPIPVVVDGQVVVRDQMKVTLSSDHRALDGVIAARFLQEIKRLLEEPFGLLL
jgi:pyruvate dehydrogenase E2 component (dihydrolipoamide acetyltransferase)